MVLVPVILLVVVVVVVLVIVVEGMEQVEATGGIYQGGKRVLGRLVVARS